MSSLPLNFTINTFNIYIGNIKDGTNYKKADIYGNVYHQLPIKVAIKLEDRYDKEGKIKPLTEYEIYDIMDSLYVCYYGNGDELLQLPYSITDSLPNNSFYYTAYYNQGYVKLLNAQGGDDSFRSDNTSSNELDLRAVLPDGTIVVPFYISVKGNANPDGLQIACGIKTNKGNLTTAKISTDVPMANNSPWTGKSFITVRTKEAIDYSKAENVKLDDGKNMWTKYDSNFKEIKTNLHTEVNPGPVTGCSGDSNGISSKISCSIIPKEPHYKFKAQKVISNTVRLGGTLLVGDGTAEMIWCEGGNNIDTSFIFINRETYGLHYGTLWYKWQGIILCFYKYYIPENTKHYWTEKLEYGKVRINFLNFRLKKSSLETDDWNSRPVPLKAQVMVVDEYGNTGTITIEARSADWPALRINGAIL